MINNMEELFRPLTKEEYDLLSKAPVYITLLAAHHDGLLNEKEQKEAIKLTHIKTYASTKSLQEYYANLEKTFEEDLSHLDRMLPAGMEEREKVIKEKLKEIRSIMNKLDPDLAERLEYSLESYSRHIARLNENVLEEIVFPLIIDSMHKKHYENETIF